MRLVLEVWQIESLGWLFVSWLLFEILLVKLFLILFILKSLFSNRHLSSDLRFQFFLYIMTTKILYFNKILLFVKTQYVLNKSR